MLAKQLYPGGKNNKFPYLVQQSQSRNNLDPEK